MIPHHSARAVALVVEDDGAVLAVVCQLLERAGYATVPASSGPEALDRLREHADIAVCLVDIGLPGMCGASLAPQLLASKPDLHIVFMSGHGEDFVQQKTAGLDLPVLSKPFRMGELLGALRLPPANGRRPLPERANGAGTAFGC